MANVDHIIEQIPEHQRLNVIVMLYNKGDNEMKAYILEPLADGSPLAEEARAIAAESRTP